MPITVLLVDDADVLRGGIRTLLGECPEIELVGEASSFAEAIQMANDLRPQIILMDLHMQRRAPTNLKYLLPLHESRLLAMSFDSGATGQAVADSLGAVGLLDKMHLSDELVPAIIRASVGKTPAI